MENLAESEVQLKVSDLKRSLLANNNSYVDEMMARNYDGLKIVRFIYRLSVMTCFVTEIVLQNHSIIS